jgi:hypothetical protein
MSDFEHTTQKTDEVHPHPHGRRPAQQDSIEDVERARALEPIHVEELTTLQLRRLDAAVMLLVNYLVAASSGDGAGLP